MGMMALGLQVFMLGEALLLAASSRAAMVPFEGILGFWGAAWSLPVQQRGIMPGQVVGTSLYQVDQVRPYSHTCMLVPALTLYVGRFGRVERRLPKRMWAGNSSLLLQQTAEAGMGSAR